MNHLTLRGTHREMGFQWGARLAERGLRLLDHVPFPLEAERRAFAAACRPAYEQHFPAALEELEGLAAGQNCRQEDLETVLVQSWPADMYFFTEERRKWPAQSAWSIPS